MLSPAGADHEAFKSAVMDAARERVAGLGAAFSGLQQIFREHHAEGVLATMACYALQRGIDQAGVVRAAAKGLEQHHIELLQAIMLTVPGEELGWRPSMPQVIQRIWDELPPLSETFLAQRLLAGENVDPQERTVLSLQERIRLHTQGVRNWGYFGEVVSISQELYGPADKALSDRLGFGGTDVILVARSLVTEFEQRMGRHFNVLKRVVAGGTAKAMVENYYKACPDLRGSAADLDEIIGAGATPENMLAMIMAHLDLRLPGVVTYRPEDLTDRSGLSSDRIRAVLQSLALKPGALATTKPEHLFLANPIWLAPAIEVRDGFLVPMPQAIFSHIHGIMRRLAEEAGATDALDRARNRYLEDTLEKTLRSALPGASVAANLSWKLGDQQFETDALAVLDRTVVIAEAKAHRLTPQGLRGAPDRVRRHIRDLIVDPSIQSQRLASLIEDARKGDAAADAVVRPLGINPTKADKVIRISVSLDDFSVLSSAEGDLREAGWVEDQIDLAPMINIADLKVIGDILDGPIEFLHYLAERGPFQKAYDLFGDELDFLGLYLGTGFAIGKLPENTRFAPSGMSKAIDRYYDAKDAGIAVTKPRMQLAPYFRSLLARLAETRQDGWTSVGMHVLGAASPDEQKEVVRRLNKARGEVRRRTAKREGGAVFTIVPGAERKASVAFYVHSHADAEALRRGMMAAADEAFSGSRSDDCVVIGRHIDDWDRPYQAVALVGRREDGTAE
jgi:hypothetical protein